MGIDFNAVLSHTFEAEELRELPRLLSAACAPRLAAAIIDLETCEAELYNRRDRKLPTLDDFNEDCWYVQPMRLALYRDDAGNLTSNVPSPIASSGPRIEALRKRRPGVVWMHSTPVVAWRTLSVKENWTARNCFDIDGHAGPRLSIGPHALGLYGWPRWWTFLTAPAIQEAIRRVCQEFARVFGSSQAIYVPDRWAPDGAILKGATIEEIAAEFRVKLGPPEPAITVLGEDTMGDASSRAYYLDTFADL